MRGTTGKSIYLIFFTFLYAITHAVQAFEQITPWQQYGEGTFSSGNSWDYAMGYHFTPKVDGVIQQLGGNFNGSKLVKLFDKTDGTQLAQATVNSNADWQYVDVIPIPVTAGRTYTVAVYLQGSGGAYQNPGTNFFPITYEYIRIEGGTYAYTGYNQDARPTNLVTTAIYGMVDIAFVPDTLSPPVITHQQVWQDVSPTNISLIKNNSWNYAMGYHFTPNMDGRISQLGGLFMGEKIVRLFDRDSGELLTEAMVSSANDWSYAPVAPVSVYARQRYTIAVYLAGSGGSYQYLNQDALPIKTGNIRIDGTTYISTATVPDARPTNSTTGYMFGTPDFIFERDEAAWEWSCEEKLWQHFTTGQLYQSGLGLLEPTGFTTYGLWLNNNGKVDYPRCSYMTGNIRIPVLMVDWEDFNPQTDLSNKNNPNSIATNYTGFTPTELSNKINGADSIGAYFNDVTGGKVSVEFDVYGWLNSAAPDSYLQPRSNYYPDIYCDKNSIVKDALRDAVVSQGLDLTRYDSDGNDVVDAVVMVYEGDAGLCSGTNMGWLDPSSLTNVNPPGMRFMNVSDLVDETDPNKDMFTNQNILIQRYNNIPETANKGAELKDLPTWIHELGHTLLGYFDSYYPKYNVADWGLSSSFSEMGHPAAWEKWLYGRWLNPGVIDENGIYKLHSNDIPDGTIYDRGAYLYVIPIDRSVDRFLVVENRWFDAEGNTYTRWAPYNNRESGLAIFEIDRTATIFDSDKLPIYRHAPERISFEGFNMTTLNAYRSEDIFQKCYQRECIQIDNISAPGNEITFKVKFIPNIQ